MNSNSEVLANAVQNLDGGRILAAEQLFRQVLQADPDQLEALHRLGMLLTQTGRYEEAVEMILDAISLSPETPLLHSHLGTALLKQDRFDEAVACFQHALILNPEDVEAQIELGTAFEKLDQLDDAVMSYRRGVLLTPSDPVVYFKLGIALQKQGHLNDAAACFQQALALKPDYVAAHISMGIAFQKQNRLDYAITCYQNALTLNPDSAEARYNLGKAWLQLGELASGWPDFESRIKVKRLSEFRLPKWDGSRLTGRRILLYAEQGLGDTIQFIRYAQLVKNSGGHVIVACQPKLLALLKGCQGIDVLVPLPKNSAEGLPAFDFYLHLLSVPNVFGTTLESIPNDVPYLRADQRLVEQWSSEIGSGDELKVGIAWQGNRQSPNDRDRSIHLTEFEPLGLVQGTKFFNLQKGDGSEQVKVMQGRLKITDFSDRMDSTTGALVDTAAIMMNLDLVITSDMAVAHLAGALGVPVWVALKHSPSWRWLLSRDDCPWYPTMRLFRQEIAGDWGGVFRRMTAELRRFKLPDGSTERALKCQINELLSSHATANSSPAAETRAT
jgi:tetratricopeptide (TPR) repeat protein